MENPSPFPCYDIAMNFDINEQLKFKPQIVNPKKLDFDNVIVGGMGGSALPARALFYLDPVYPLWLHNDYGLPKKVEKKALFIAISYSGNTLEVESFAKEACEKNPTGPVPFEIQGDGSQTRAFVHIDDFTDGIMTMVHRGEHLGLYHIGHSEELTIRQVAEGVLKAFGRDVKIIPGPEPKGATPRRCPDISKLKKLGYNPQTSFKDGIQPMVDWYVKNAHLKPQK